MVSITSVSINTNMHNYTPESKRKLFLHLKRHLAQVARGQENTMRAGACSTTHTNTNTHTPAHQSRGAPPRSRAGPACPCTAWPRGCGTWRWCHWWCSHGHGRTAPPVYGRVYKNRRGESTKLFSMGRGKSKQRTCSKNAGQKRDQEYNGDYAQQWVRILWRRDPVRTPLRCRRPSSSATEAMSTNPDLWSCSDRFGQCASVNQESAAWPWACTLLWLGIVGDQSQHADKNKDRHIPHKRRVGAERSVNTTAVQAEVDTVRNTRPCRVLCAHALGQDCIRMNPKDCERQSNWRARTVGAKNLRQTVGGRYQHMHGDQREGERSQSHLCAAIEAMLVLGLRAQALEEGRNLLLCGLGHLCGSFPSTTIRPPLISTRQRG